MTPPPPREKAPPVTSRREFLRWAFQRYERFCGLLHIVGKDGKRQPLRLNRIQKQRQRARTARDVVLKPRQVGMTTEECARDMWCFLTMPGSRVVTVVQSMTDHLPLKQVSTIYQTMFAGLREAGVRLYFRHETTAEWVFPERDSSLRIIEAGAAEATAEKKGRAGTITRLHATEVAFWEYADATLTALLQCVPQSGEVTLESTPNGAAGPFFEYCTAAREGRSVFRLHFFPWLLQPEYRTPLAADEKVVPTTERERTLAALGAAPEQLKWRRLKIAELRGKEALFDQEFPTDAETCFILKGRTFFDKMLCLRMLHACTAPMIEQARGLLLLRIWKAPEPGARYVVAADTSEGIAEGNEPLERQKPDAAAAVVRKRGTGEHVATLWGIVRPDALADQLVPLGQLFNNATIAVERNNHGHATLSWLIRHHRYPHVYVDDDGRPGWLNSAPRRSAALDHLETAYRNGNTTSPDRYLVGQMATFIIDARTGTPRAAAGAHDDLVIADAIAWHVVCRPETYRTPGATPSPT